MRLVSLVLYAGLALGANLPLAAGAGVLDGLNTGAMRKLVPAAAPVPPAAFLDESGAERRLADWSGAPVLVNFWATWCMPCREEMPALERLAEAYEGTGFEVLTVATGRSRPAQIDRFFAETGLARLPKHLDPDMSFARAMGVLGLPVSVLIDARGREVARLIGDAHWDGPEARAVVDALLAEAAAGSE